DNDGQRRSCPAAQALTLVPALVLAVEEASREVVFVRPRADDARFCPHRTGPDAQPHVRVPLDVADPVRVRAASREEVDTSVVEPEPDLDRVFPTGGPAGRRQVGEVLIREALEHCSSTTRPVRAW